MKPAFDIASLVVAAACIGMVVFRAASAPSPPPAPKLSAETRAAVAITISSQERDWRERAADDFPADQWSQRDAFHGHEAAAVRELARGNGSYEEVFRAIDDDIHKHRGIDRSAVAVPCHPRPVFD